MQLHSFGLDLLLYIALLVLFIWRYLCPWRCCGRWLEMMNYCTLLYALMHGLLIYEIIELVKAARLDFKLPADSPLGTHSVIWLRVLVLSTPAALVIILTICWFQTRQHVVMIRANAAAMQHDRAVSIIALPAVYALMAMSATVRLYVLASSSIDQDHREVALSRYETCFYVADLYEAWALYQFGKLTLEVLGHTFRQREVAHVEQQGPSDVFLSFTAVSSLTWLGTWMFVVVCVIQAGWSLWLWVFQDAASDWESYESSMRQFSYAGLVASAAAVYNVHTVEHTFSPLIGSYSPFLKFLSVKLLVFFSFWQRHIFAALSNLHVIQLTSMQVKLLSAGLLVYECLLSASLHWWAWGAQEDWYNIVSTCEEEKGETAPLFSRGAAAGGAPPRR